MGEHTEVFILLGIYAATSSGTSALLALLTRLLARLPDRPGLKEWVAFTHLSSVVVAAFCVSVSFTIFNKLFMQIWHGGFHFPILTTTIHMLLKVGVSRLWMWRNESQVFSDLPDQTLPPASWDVFLSLVAPIGILTALDVMLSNLGILFAPLSIYTAVKGSVPVFIFFFGIALGTERFSLSVLLALGGIAGGLAVAVEASADSSALGVALCFAAAAAGGLRWALTERLRHADEASARHVMVLLHRFSPMSALTILPLGLWLELPALLRAVRDGDWPPALLAQAGAISLFGGCISFLLIALELSLVSLTSSLALGVLGTCKEMLQIGLSLVIFREKMGWQTGLGLAFAVGSGAAYRRAKAAQRSETERVAAEEGETEALLVELRSVFSLKAAEDGEDDEDGEGERDEEGGGGVGEETKEGGPKRVWQK